MIRTEPVWQQEMEVRSLSGLTTIALVVGSVWLGVLTLVIVLSVRQIGLLTVRLSTTRNNEIPETIEESDFSVDSDGPEVGSEIPEEMTSVLPDLSQDGMHHILLVSANCSPCRELASELRRQSFTSPVTALVAGRNEGLADGLEELLPSGVRTVRDPEATKLARSLNIQSTPFAVAVGNGRVVKKTYVYRPADFVEFVEDRSTSTPVEITTKLKEIDHVG